ncbi:hypothetical protein DAT35_28640 [Vitiosangium sp. GDMCC 1.1324]|nr:hypothetical protein DAT35_28640 [Vitiosangium sp. GDMCC 1.1324]
MGDRFQVLVDSDVSAEEAPRLAENVRGWLVSRRIIEPVLSDCTLGESGHPPGAAHTTVLENPSSDAFRYLTNGLEITVGRTFFWTPYTDLTCRMCGARFDPYSDPWVDAVGVWHQGDDSATFDCPKCGRPERVAEWSGESPCGFGNLGLTFWNWPPLSSSFVREMTELLGHRTVLVRGKL